MEESLRLRSKSTSDGMTPPFGSEPSAEKDALASVPLTFEGHSKANTGPIFMK